MIAATVEELTPLIGTRPACRALGASAGDDLPSPPPARAQAAEAAADACAGADEAERGGCWRCCTASGSSTSRRRRPRRRCWTRAPTCARPARCTGSSPPKHGGVRERRDQLTHPAYAKPELLADAAERAVVLGLSEAQGPGEVDLVLPVRDPRRVQPLRRRLDGPVPRERPARQGADRAGHRAAADHPQGADAARRPRRGAARQASGVLARRSRHHENAQSARTPPATTPTRSRTSRP